MSAPIEPEPRPGFRGDIRQTSSRRIGPGLRLHYPGTLCGIVGYGGARPARGIVVDALRRMEYRGYDSAGIALIDDNGGLTVRRRAGRLANLEAALAETDDGACLPARPAWATPGGPPTAGPTDRNAHPHRDAAGKIAVVHNGIIENFAGLRAELEADGVEFASDTDSEVAVHLVARQYANGDTAGDFPASVLAVLAAPGRPLHPGVRQRRRSGHDRGRSPVHPCSSSASVRTRCSSAPTGRRSSSTPGTPWSSARTRRWC